MMSQHKLFPQYLQAGSRGAAVVNLQLWLKGALSMVNKPLAQRLVPDGDYGGMTVEAVQEIQMFCNRTENLARLPGRLTLDVDGNFGPATRAAVNVIYGVDFNEVPFFENTQAKFPGQEDGYVIWPPPASLSVTKEIYWDRSGPPPGGP